MQHAIRHLFSDASQRTGSARAVVQAFNQDGLLFPTRVRTGERKGELAWMPLRHWRVLRTLHNPRYAGAFVYGRRRTRKTADGQDHHRDVPREQWTALIPDAHPGYITLEQFEPNQHCSPPTPKRTAPSAPPAPPAKGPRCCKASRSADAADDG